MEFLYALGWLIFSIVGYMSCRNFTKNSKIAEKECQNFASSIEENYKTFLNQLAQEHKNAQLQLIQRSFQQTVVEQKPSPPKPPKPPKVYEEDSSIRSIDFDE